MRARVAPARREGCVWVAPEAFAPAVERALEEQREVVALSYAELRRAGESEEPAALVLEDRGPAAGLLDRVRELRARGVSTPCLCVSASAGDHDRTRANSLANCQLVSPQAAEGAADTPLAAALAALLGADASADPGTRAGADGTAANEAATAAAAASARASVPPPGDRDDWAPAVSWRTDAAGDLRALAPRWALLTGRDADREGAESWLEAIHPDDRPAFREQWSEAVEAAREFRADLRVRRADGRWLWVRIHGIPCLDREGHYDGHVGSTYDIDDLRRQLDSAREQCERLGRAAAEVDELRAVATHDLREPVRGLRYLLARLADEGESALAEGVAAQCQELATNLDDLVEALQDYASAGRIALCDEAVDLRQALDWALANLEASLAAERAEVVVDPLPEVRADPVQIGRVFQNLIANALRFRGPRAPAIRVSAKTRGNVAIISVEDNGIGIPAEAHETIFRVFERLHGPERPGTGTGLAICRKLIERHGGRIQVDSEPDKGAIFHFTLPLSGRSTAA